MCAARVLSVSLSSSGRWRFPSTVSTWYGRPCSHHPLLLPCLSRSICHTNLKLTASSTAAASASSSSSSFSTSSPPAAAAGPPAWSDYPGSNRVKNFGASVFTEFTALANQVSAVNLGQGFPDFPTEDFVKESGVTAVRGGPAQNQYTRSAGYVPLVQSLTKYYSPKVHRLLDPLTNFVVTAGATEAGFAVAQAIFNPGDEAILFEPFYDMYPAQVTMAGAYCKFVPMRRKNCPPSIDANGKPRYHSSDFVIDPKELEAAITPKTKAIYLTNPHNPLGKCFSREEFEMIADILCKPGNEHIIVISDDVYEELVFDNTEMVRFCTIPNMWDRTITLGSAGKTFSVTGWKIGWTLCAPHFSSAIFKAHQWQTFCVSTPLQDAVAAMFDEAMRSDYFPRLRSVFTKRRDALVDGLAAAGMAPIVPAGGYFVVADTAALTIPWDDGERYAADETRDFAFARWLSRTAKVTPIPCSAFYSSDAAHLAKDMSRFAFCKKDETIGQGVLRLKALAETQAKQKEQEKQKQQSGKENKHDT